MPEQNREPNAEMPDRVVAGMLGAAVVGTGRVRDGEVVDSASSAFEAVLSYATSWSEDSRGDIAREYARRILRITEKGVANG